MTIIGFIGPAIALTCMTFIGCDSVSAVLFLCLAVMIEGTGYAGYNVNELELSPNYAGTLKGATGTIANICGFLAPALVGAITDSEQSVASWNNVFYISAFIYVIGTLIFVSFSRTSVQPWNAYWQQRTEPHEGQDSRPALLNNAVV